MRTRTILLGCAALIALLSLAGTAAAQDAPKIYPTCGTEGDPLFVRGEGFARAPTVKVDGVEAKVLRSKDIAILCLVPSGTSLGEVEVTVDGDVADGKFTVLADGSPVVLKISAETVTPGMHVFLVGRRLRGGTADFEDSTGTSQASVELEGGRRASMLTVPEDLTAGVYTLKITNVDELDTGDCSPEIEVLEADTPALDTIEPAGQLPGQQVKISGNDLNPGGFCMVTWTDTAGDVLKFPGFSNGYDEVVSRVPPRADHGITYEVAVELRGVSDPVGSLTYAVGTPDAPEITKLDPANGPAGSLFRVIGSNFLVFGEKPRVEMAMGGDILTARILSFRPAFKDRGEELLVLVPKDAEDGEYDVTVAVGTRKSDPATFTVGARPLTVDSMRPDSQGERGTFRPVFIEGTGFGSFKGDPIAVTWDDGSGGDALEGRIIFRSDRLLMVVPPGGFKDPLPLGTYTVEVVLDPDGQATSVSAGTYTVE